MKNERILNDFNHFKIVKYALLDTNKSEVNQIHMTDNISNWYSISI